MIIQRNESVIVKKVKVLRNSILGGDYKVKEYQRFLRTTWTFLFIPIFKHDKRV